MRAWVIILFLPIVSLAQDLKSRSQADDISLQRNIFSFTEIGAYTPERKEELFQFIEKLEGRRLKINDDKKFLHVLFNKTHRQFLKQFRAYSSFNELLNSGKYNCLTATALYGVLLDHFGFKYSIIETNYHVFIIANTAQGKVLIESTDPLQGFVTNVTEIEKKVVSYRKNTVDVNATKNYLLYDFELYNQVNLRQLTGLMQYNASVKAYNEGYLALAINYLDKAMALYQSPRLEAFSKIVLLSVVQSKLDVSVKESYVRKLQVLRKKSRMAVASRSL
jgi:hypothetical protein